MRETIETWAHSKELTTAVDQAIDSAFGCTRRTVRKNLAALTTSFLGVLGAARSGQGRLSLATLYRLLPTNGSPHAREKRLGRFLNNKGLDPHGVSSGLAKLIFGKKGQGLWPVVFDQTKAGSTQSLVAGVPFEGRVMPLAAYTFDYPWKTIAPHSQNDLERIFLIDVQSALPAGVKAVFIGDRGFARAALLRQCWDERRLFIIRGRRGTVVYHQGKRTKLGDLKTKAHKAKRFHSVLYHAKQQVPVDIIVYREPAFDETWYLLVPPFSEEILGASQVVDLYRQRMKIEQAFRDFKTHLGLRGLKLKVRIAERMGRLILAFLIAYCLALLLGISDEAYGARRDLEILRTKPRHGTRRTLSVLFIAMQMLSHPKHKDRALWRLRQIAGRIADGLPALPPELSPLQDSVAA